MAKILLVTWSRLCDWEGGEGEVCTVCVTEFRFLFVAVRE